MDTTNLCLLVGIYVQLILIHYNISGAASPLSGVVKLTMQSHLHICNHQLSFQTNRPKCRFQIKYLVCIVVHYRNYDLSLLQNRIFYERQILHL